MPAGPSERFDVFDSKLFYRQNCPILIMLHNWALASAFLSCSLWRGLPAQALVTSLAKTQSEVLLGQARGAQDEVWGRPGKRESGKKKKPLGRAWLTGAIQEEEAVADFAQGTGKVERKWGLPRPTPGLRKPSSTCLSRTMAERWGVQPFMSSSAQLQLKPCGCRKWIEESHVREHLHFKVKNC